MCNFDSSFEMGQCRKSDKTARIVEMPMTRSCCNQSLSNCQETGRVRKNKSATCSHLPSTAFIMRFPTQKKIELPPKLKRHGLQGNISIKQCEHSPPSQSLDSRITNKFQYGTKV